MKLYRYFQACNFGKPSRTDENSFGRMQVLYVRHVCGFLSRHILIRPSVASTWWSSA